MESRVRRANKHTPMCVVYDPSQEEPSMPHLIDIGTDLYLLLLLDLSRPLNYTPDEWARLVLESHVQEQRQRGAL
ncbi:MAG TPA: hypothetical protein PKN45_12275 [Candidatus Limiplasma sp.]|nr:hypothetical protein [Candidatus Limiplasma sp.]